LQQHCKLQLTKGQSYFRGAEGALLCFDLTHRPSWLAVPQWYEDLIQFGEDGIVITLVGTKLDLVEDGKTERQVTPEEVEAFCKEHGDLQYIETSSKNGTNVEEVR
jgi:GTPase SAR1 family protein